MHDKFLENSNFELLKVDDEIFYHDRETGEIFKILSDKSSTGKERPWRKHKVENTHLEKVYRLLSQSDSDERDHWQKRADNLSSCGNFLKFNVYSDGQGVEVKKIKSADLCRIRLCPLCSWRRSIKIQVHTRKIIEKMQEEEKYTYLVLTLTVPNCSGIKLSETLDNLFKGWNLFAKTKKFKTSVLGWYRALEVTHNVNPLSQSFDTYHPHFHCILAVDKDYFKPNSLIPYISRSEWLCMWQKAMKNDSITQVDIRKVKPKFRPGVSISDSIISSVCEVAKYSVKSSDYIDPTDWLFSCSSVRILDKALSNRRLVAYGGAMKDWHKKLNLDDEIDGDLLSDSEDINLGLLRVESAFWHVGYQQYLMN